MSLFELTVIVVLTGIIVVFAVLTMLTLATMGYSILVKKFFMHKSFRDPYQLNNITEFSEEIDAETLKNNDESNEMVDKKIIAVIASAIYSVESNNKYAIKSIKLIDTEKHTISPWRLSGMLKNTRLFKF